MQFAGRQQPDQALGVALIGLDAVARATRHQPRRAHDTVDARLLQAPRTRKARRPGFIGRADRTLQAGHERRDLLAASRQPPTPKLA